nr:ribosomal protein S4 [Thismia rodwayi]
MYIYNEFYVKKKVNVYKKKTRLEKKLVYPLFFKKISKQIYYICLLEKHFYFFKFHKIKMFKFKYSHILSKKKKPKKIIFLQLFGMRLDNIIFKIGLCSFFYGAKQLINHKHILINGHILNKPSYFCNYGDLISIKKKKVLKLIIL